MEPSALPKTVAFADPLVVGTSTPDVSTCSAVRKSGVSGGSGGAAALKPRNTVQTLLFGVVGIMFGLSIMYLISRIMAMNRKIVQLERENKRQVTAEYVDELVARTVKEMAPAPAPVHKGIQPSIPLPVAAAGTAVPHKPAAAVSQAPPPPSVQPTSPAPSAAAPKPTPSVDRAPPFPIPMPIPFDMNMMPLQFGMPLPPDMLMELLMSGGGIMEINMADLVQPPHNESSESRFEVVDESSIAPLDAPTDSPATAEPKESSPSAVDKVVSDTLGPLARVVDALEQESKSRESVDAAHTTDDAKSESSEEESSDEPAIRLGANPAPVRRSTRRAGDKKTAGSASARQRKK